MDKKIIVKVKQLKIENQTFIDDMLENNDVKRILNAAIKAEDIRATTIIYTLFYTGARVSEMLQIKVADVNKYSDVSFLTFRYLFHSDFNFLGINSSLYFDPLPLIIIESLFTSEYLFTGERGPINRQTVHNTIKLYTGKARGIDKSISHAHAFRHLYSQNLASLGVAPVVISQLLGHSLTVTGLYMQVSKKDLLKIINKIDVEGEKNKRKR